jgi:hypothetical protein
MREIPLTQGYVALVDDEDFERFGHLKWCVAIGMNGHVQHAKRRISKVPNVCVTLHREIMQAAPHEVVDHKNGNPLDCRRENLRRTTQHRNTQNKGLHHNKQTSKYKGVSKTQQGNYRARIYAGHEIWLGRFDNEEDAARAYDEAARKHFGEFAALNFPRAGERAA